MSNVQHGSQPEGEPEVVHGDQPLLEVDDARVQVVVHGSQPAETPPTSDDDVEDSPDDGFEDDDTPTSDDDGAEES